MARSGDCNLAMVESRSVGDELVNSDLGISSSWMTNSSIRFSTTTSSSITCRTHLDPPVTCRASFQSMKKAVTMNQIISSLCHLFTVATAYPTSKPTRSWSPLFPLGSERLQQTSRIDLGEASSTLSPPPRLEFNHSSPQPVQW